MRVAILFLVAVLVAPRIADACGVWHMTDPEKKLDVTWVIDAGKITRPKPNAKPGDEQPSITVAAIYLDETTSGLRVVRDRKVLLDIVGGKVRKLGKVVGTIDKDTIKFGNRAYTIEWTDVPKQHDMPSWKVTVKRGDTVVLEAPNAWALCAGMKAAGMMADDDQKTEIRNRIAFYLAWREVGI